MTYGDADIGPRRVTPGSLWRLINRAGFPEADFGSWISKHFTAAEGIALRQRQKAEAQGGGAASLEAAQ